MAQQIALLVNPASGRGRSAVVGSRLLRELRSRGADVTVHIGRSPADSVRLAREAVAAGPDALAVVGGDGLVHGALQAVVGTDVPLGIVPAGTGNDIARAFEVPRTVPGAAAAILDGGAADADTVRAGGRHYLSVLACGFDSRVNERVNGFRFGLGRANYLIGLAAELSSFTPIPFTVEVDGQRLEAEGMLVAVGNTTSYGGGMRICPEAVADDGRLEVVFVHAVPRASFLRFFPRVFDGSHTGLDEVTVLRGRTVTISAAGPAGRPVVGYADGERLSELPVTCEVVPGSVRVLR
ncbi:diacylglycerol kinase (ATP) [Nocardiopsis mwathae]|uniref:Diacylglycerol kinase (ATP) n=1 Tax=Nocardiopsis mwathae TaxID=1472723 RepID=A0A7X0D5B6_9ACTN|nr:YegS/Rv2252/BmrU family lipid kinase [Nocardiopsis mwathae]MBB6172040.1 diacylglycerol kinase (ATP) [Nocardiopsis mwathae]